MSFIVILTALALSMLGVISTAVFDVVFALAIATVPLAFLPKIGTSMRGAAVFSFVLILAILLAWATIPNIRFTPYLAVALANAAVAYMFLRGQMAGRTPLIIQMIDLIDMAPIGSASFRRFIYWQCWAWVVFGVITSLTGLVASFTPEFRSLSGVVIAALVIAQIAWFFLSHGYANWRYRRPETCWDTIRVMSRSASWDALRV